MRHSRALHPLLVESKTFLLEPPLPRKKGAWALPILIADVECSPSQRGCEEGFVLVLRSLQMLRTRERGDEPRNCIKYVQELWWPNCDPKSSGVPSSGSGAGRGGWAWPWSTSCKVTAELDPGVFSQKIAAGGGKRREPTHPPSPHTCSVQPSLEHVVAQLSASRASAGTHYLARACTTRPGVPNQEEAALPGAEQPAPEPVSSQPSTATWTEFSCPPTNPRPRQLPTTPTFLCHLTNR